MGRTPLERMRMLAPFESCQMDLAGPMYAFTHIGGRRQKVKCYILVTACMSTHAVWLTLLEALSADALLGGIHRISARFGKIRRIYSDKGTNLAAIANRPNVDASDLGEDVTISDSEQQRLKLLLLKNETELLTHTAKAPWQTGQAEVTVRELKRRIKALGLGGTMMSHLEYETLLAQISHYLNNKPLILLPQVGESLTPNDLLHGMLKRKDAFVAPTDTNLFKRQSMLANNLERWWNTFIQAWENKLVELSKWRIPHPNPTKGSLALILDRKIGNSYQLGEIVNVVENEDGLVNVCTVQYTVNGKKKRFDRPVRGLSVVMTANLVE